MVLRLAARTTAMRTWCPNMFGRKWKHVLHERTDGATKTTGILREHLETATWSDVTVGNRRQQRTAATTDRALLLPLKKVGEHGVTKERYKQRSTAPCAGTSKRSRRADLRTSLIDITHRVVDRHGAMFAGNLRTTPRSLKQGERRTNLLLSTTLYMCIVAHRK